MLLELPCGSSPQIIDGLLKELGNTRLEEEDVLSTPVNKIVGLLEEALLPFTSFNMMGVLLEEEADTDEMLDALLEESNKTDVVLEEEDVLSTPVNRIVGLLEEIVLPFISPNLTGLLLEEGPDPALVGESDRTDVPLEEEDVPPTLFNWVVGLLKEAALPFADLAMTGVLFAEEAGLVEILDALENLDRTYPPPLVGGADLLLRVPS